VETPQGASATAEGDRLVVRNFRGEVVVTYDAATGSATISAPAGDLRLARRIAEKARRVIAWEIQPDLLAQQAARLPENLTAVCTDARFEPVPSGVTAAVLLMRHCQHFDLYVKTLRMSGCRRLITNARWGLDVEVIDLQTPRRLYAAAPMGWYACWCGQTGFKPGRVEMFTPEMETAVHEVIDCPNCREN
jgi:hypothetical protein